MYVVLMNASFINFAKIKGNKTKFNTVLLQEIKPQERISLFHDSSDPLNTLFIYCRNSEIKLSLV